MGVAIFGAKCSPAIANYVLHKAADDSLKNSDDLAEAAETIKRNFYMDDIRHGEVGARREICRGSWTASKSNSLKWRIQADQMEQQ